MFDAVEEDFNQMTLLVAVYVVLWRLDSRWVRANDCLNTLGGNLVSYLLAIVCRVRKEEISLCELNQITSNSRFVALAGG